MPDPYLAAMMRGDFSKDKAQSKSAVSLDRFSLLIEKSVNDYLDTIDFEEGFETQVQSSQMKRSKIKEELQEALKMQELNQNIQTAFQVLLRDGKESLESEEYLSLIEELSQMGNKISQINLEPLPQENFQTLLKMSDQTMRSLLKIAVSKFVTDQFDDSFALFILLVTLNSSHPEYWFRSGMAAHQNNQLDLALRSYKVAAELDPKLIGAPLFIAECYLRQGNREEAETAYKQAQAIAASYEIDVEWKELLNSIGASLKKI